MLCEYYDTAAHFNDLFGPLYIGKNPTLSHNKHLVLKFDLSSINVSGSIDEMKERVSITESMACWCTSLKNTAKSLVILKLIIWSNQMTLLGPYSSGYFDEYDAPVNNSVFTGDTTVMPEAIKKVSQVEQFFKERFFAPLSKYVEGLLVASKYFLTGVTPAFRAGISPLIEAIIVSDEPELHGICGFTENEVRTIVQYYLLMDEQEADTIAHSMRKLYNGYYFAGRNYDESDPQPSLLSIPISFSTTFENTRVFKESLASLKNLLLSIPRMSSTSLSF